MAARRTIDLGTVGFGLVPDTKALEQSLRTLKAFGRQVDQIAGSAGWGDPLYRKFASIERILSTLQARVTATTQRMRESGVAVAEINKIEQAYRRLTDTLTRQASALGRHEIARGTVGMNAILAAGNRLAAGQEGDKFARTFRDLERAAILAVGPLSGLGARLAVLSALFESTSIHATLFIAGIVGVTTGVAYLASSSIKAVIDMQRFDAMLATSTGSANLAGDEYNYVAAIANKLGQNVRGLVEPYAKFTTAARLSNLSLNDQRYIFEAAITAGTAMRISQERMGLIFLALEQMVSKGTVSMEELRRQLGDLLPGSMALAARAMGVTETKLFEMIKKGEVLAKDLLPKLAQQWMLVFGPGAQQASVALQAEMARLGSSSFEVLKAFDKMSKFSELFRKTVVSTREALTYLTQNMQRVGQVFSAVAGAGAGMLLYSLLLRLPAAVAAVTAGLIALRAAILGVGTATAALESSTVLLFLLRMGLLLGGAAVGYALLARATETASDKTKDWLDRTGEWINIQKQVGEAHRQTTEQMKQGTATRLRGVYSEIAAIEAQIAVQIAQAEGKATTAPARMTMTRAGKMVLLPPPPVEEDPTVKALTERLNKVKGISAALEAQMSELQNLKLAPELGKSTAGEAGDAYKGWVKRIEERLREAQSLNDQIKAGEFGTTAMQEVEALNKAMDLMASMPEKKRGGLGAIGRSLREAGFEGKNLTEQLQRMFLAIDQRKETVKELEQLPKKMAAAGLKMGEMFDELEAHRKGAEAADPGKVKQQEQLEKSLEKLRDFLTDMRLDQEQINFLTAEYSRRWQEVTGIEAHKEKLKDVKREIESIRSAIGDTGEKAIYDATKRVEKINEAVRLNVLSHAEASKMIETINDDTYRKMLDRTTLFGKSVRDMFRDLEKGSLDAFYDLTHGVEGGWKRLFLSMERTVFDFVAKLMIIQPTMKFLFGGLYTGRNVDVGTGLLEGMMGKLLTAPTSAATANLGGSSLIGQFQHGGSFVVGGSGGADSQLVQFMATPGEKVSVSPSTVSQSIHVSISNESGTPLAVRSAQPSFSVDRAVISIILDDIRRGGPTAQALEARGMRHRTS